MNIAIKSDHLAATKALADRVSMVTGSTTGIGLGIWRALGTAGSAVVLNGFGRTDDKLPTP
jgi:3-hydroxybutyrate dehydrogenase